LLVHQPHAYLREIEMSLDEQRYYQNRNTESLQFHSYLQNKVYAGSHNPLHNCVRCHYKYSDHLKMYGGEIPDLLSYYFTD